MPKTGSETRQELGQELRVDLGSRSYPIFIADGLLGDPVSAAVPTCHMELALTNLIRSVLGPAKVAMVAETEVKVFEESPPSFLA